MRVKIKPSRVCSAIYYFGLNSTALLLFQGSLLPVREVFYQLLILLPLGGMLIGGTGSYFATMKFLNK